MTHLMLRRKLFILPMTAETPSLFEEIFVVENLNAAKQALNLSQVFQEAVESNGHFNVNKAMGITKQEPNMIVAALVDQTFTQTYGCLKNMVDWVEHLFDNLLGISLPQKQHGQMQATISYIFNNLDTQTTDPWIFYEKRSAHSTIYQYNILFAVQNASTEEFVYGVPMGITIRVDQDYEQGLSFTTQNKASYEVRVEALKVMQLLDCRFEDFHERKIFSQQQHKAFSLC